MSEKGNLIGRGRGGGLVKKSMMFIYDKTFGQIFYRGSVTVCASVLRILFELRNMSEIVGNCFLFCTHVMEAPVSMEMNAYIWALIILRERNGTVITLFYGTERN